MSKRDRREPVADAEIRSPEPKPALVKLEKRTARPGFLLVATNPYHAIDHLGRPCGACPIDPQDPRFYDPSKGMGEVRGSVGAYQLFGEVLRKVTSREEQHSHRTERRDLQWQFKYEAFEVPDTRFYRRMLADGALLDGTADYEGARRLAKSRAQCAADPLWITD